MNEDFIRENVKKNIHDLLIDPPAMRRLAEGAFKKADPLDNGFLTQDEIVRLTKDFLAKIQVPDLLSDQQIETIFKESLLNHEVQVMEVDSYVVFLKIFIEVIYEFL